MPLRKKRVKRPPAHLCPHCGEPIDVWPDIGGGEHQSYIEDCPVCCRPNRITATLDETLRDFTIEITPED